MAWVIVDAELLGDQGGDAAPGPDGATEAKGFGALSQQDSELVELGDRELWAPSRGRVGAQSRDASGGDAV
jgi:hypothetical protein